MDEDGLERAWEAAKAAGANVSRKDISLIVNAYLHTELQATILYVSGRNSRITRGKTPASRHRLIWEGERMAYGDMRLPGIVGVCTEGDGRPQQEGGRYSTRDLVRLEAMHCGLPDPWPRGG